MTQLRGISPCQHANPRPIHGCILPDIGLDNDVDHDSSVTANPSGSVMSHEDVCTNLTLADLDLLEELGKGRYSVVKRARLKNLTDNQLPNQFAVKCIARIGLGALSLRRTHEEKRVCQQLTAFRDTPELQPSETNERARMICEALSAVPRFYKSLQDDNYLYLVMEYVRGHSLAQVLANQSLYEQHFSSIHCIIEFTRQLTRTVLGLHFGFGMAHRDLKPANLILEPIGTSETLDDRIRTWPYRIRLIDFGSVRALDHVNPARYVDSTLIFCRSSRLPPSPLQTHEKPLDPHKAPSYPPFSRSDSFSGTIPYMLPERAACMAAGSLNSAANVENPAIQVGFLKQDIWSIIAIVFETTTRRTLVHELHATLLRTLQGTQDTGTGEDWKELNQSNDQNEEQDFDNVDIGDVHTHWLGPLRTAACRRVTEQLNETERSQFGIIEPPVLYFHISSMKPPCIQAQHLVCCLNTLLSIAFMRFPVDYSSFLAKASDTTMASKIEAVTLGFLEWAEAILSSQPLLTHGVIPPQTAEEELSVSSSSRLSCPDLRLQIGDAYDDILRSVCIRMPRVASGSGRTESESSVWDDF